MEEKELFKQITIRNEYTRQSTVEGIKAFQHGFFAEDCPYEHQILSPRVYDINNPNVYMEEKEMINGVSYRWKLPPLEYVKAEAWKQGWLLAYWHKIMMNRKGYIKKIIKCVKHLNSCGTNHIYFKNLVEEGFFKHYLKHFQNIKNLKKFESEFYTSSEYKFLVNLHLEASLSHLGKVEWFDAFLVLTRHWERKLGIAPTEEYLFRLCDSTKEVKELKHYWDEERFYEEYRIEL